MKACCARCQSIASAVPSQTNPREYVMLTHKVPNTNMDCDEKYDIQALIPTTQEEKVKAKDHQTDTILDGIDDYWAD